MKQATEERTTKVGSKSSRLILFMFVVKMKNKLDTSAGTGKLCILGHLGLVFICCQTFTNFHVTGVVTVLARFT